MEIERKPDLEYVQKMVIGAYRKFKALVYYDSTYILLKKKIAVFETTSYKSKLKALSNAMYSHRLDEYVATYIDRIDFYPFTKKRNQDKEKITSTETSINFFVDIPIELHVIDVIWTILACASINHDEAMTYNFGNLIDTDSLYINNNKYYIDYTDINWDNPSFFQKYAIGYNKWITKARRVLDKERHIREHITLISSDISRYYYSTNNPIGLFETRINYGGLSWILEPCTKAISWISEVYVKRIKEYSSLAMGSNPLPIGLTSSMFLANLYLSSFDAEMNESPQVLFYGRYVDDMIVILDGDLSNDKAVDFIAKKLMSRNAKINHEKTKTFHIKRNATYDALSELFAYMESVQNDYYGPEDMEDVSFRKYFAFEKKALKDDLLRKADIKENALLEMDPKDLLLIMNHTLNLVQFGDHTIRDAYSNVLGFLETNPKFNMWKEAYLWVYSFCGENELIEISNTIIKAYSESIDNRLSDVHPQKSDSLKKRLFSVYNEIHEVSRELALYSSGKANLKTNIYHKSGMGRKESILIHLIKGIINGKVMTDNSTKYYKNYYGSQVRFIPLWEIQLFDWLVDIYGNSQKTLEESFHTYIELNHHYDIEMLVEHQIDISNNLIRNKVQINNGDHVHNSYIVSQPKINIDVSKGFTILHVKPSLDDTRHFVRNLIECTENQTNLYVLPENYVKLEWLYFFGLAACKKEFNAVFGLECVVVKKRFINVIGAFYSYRDSRMHRSLFVTAREKTFYSFIERDFCASKKIKCLDATSPSYFLVKNNGVSYADYLCYEVTDILSRALFKGQVDIITIPMLNKDTDYFNNIIYSLSRDLSCCVITANSAVWGNSSIVLPKKSAEKLLTDFKGGFNHYLVSTIVPIFDLVHYNETFDRYSCPHLERDFKPHPANYVHHHMGDDPESNGESDDPTF